MANSIPVQLSSLELKNFRCFSHLTLDFSAPYILLEGANGIGKTSILEALYYTCYLRSFRTYSPKELISFKQNELFVKVEVASPDGLSHTIQIGMSRNKRLVKVDQRSISSFKELMSYYRVISLTEDDLSLIQGSPQFRRLFLDQMLLLLTPEYGVTLKEYKKIVDQKNALLQNIRVDNDTYHALSRQQWIQAKDIEKQRSKTLSSLSEKVASLNKEFVAGSPPISFSYKAKKILLDSYDDFMAHNPGLKELELRYRRSLFGAHLDDFSITFQERQSRVFASRGQQKLLLLLIKIAQMHILRETGCPSIFLLDDFMTDFDENRALELVSALGALDAQLIFTSPIEGGILSDKVKNEGGQILKVTI